ncbi:MAG: ABC transporter substrate-binding protein [Lachnospiraceae bacterium]|nr:ABC transporter substrate-binding protein [Lachnospiraceae bacterium]
MSRVITRRDFLKGSAAGAAGIALSGILGGSFVMAEETLADSLTVGLQVDPETFGPWTMAQAARQQIMYFTIFEPLAMLTVDGEREMVLAKSVEAEGDMCYRIELYDYIYDSIGNHITASDVIFSFDQAIAQGALSWATKYLDHFDQEDDYTLLMYVQDESAVALDMLLKTVFIVSEESYNASSDGFVTNPIGTGPYQLDSYTAGSEAQISLRGEYWQTDESLISTSATTGSIQNVTFKVITDTTQLALALEMGDVDAVPVGITTTDLGNFLNDDRTPKEGYNVETLLNPLLYFMAFNCGENSPCADVNVRQAISYAIDMDAIVTNVFGTDAVTATTNSSPYYADYDEALDEAPAYGYDADKAKELLEEAGYSDGDITLELMINTESNYAQVASLVQAYLTVIGISVNITTYESGLFTTTKNSETDWDMFLDCTQGLNTPGRMGLLDINGYTTGANGVFVTDDTLQSLFEAANAATTYSTETVTDLLTYVDEMDYVYPMFYQYSYVLTDDEVTEISVDRNYSLIYGKCTVLAD